MRDDERYPIALSPGPETGLPEVTGADVYANPRDKYPVPPQEAPYGDFMSTPASTPDSVGKGYPIQGEGRQDPSRRTIWGLKRRTFWIVTAAVALVFVIGGVVGGVVGGLEARRATQTTTPSPSTTTSPPAASPTGPLAPSDRAIAASSTSGSTTSTLQVFYQDLNTTDILYRLAWDDNAKPQQTLQLQIPPNQGTPLAVTAANSTSTAGIQVNVFYLSTDGPTGNTTIAQATLECPQASASCDTSYNAVISANATRGVNKDSQLAAVLLDDSPSFRVYFQARELAVWAMAGDQPLANGWSPLLIGGPAIQGSSLAALLEGTPSWIMVLFVANGTGLLRAVEYNDALGPAGANTVDNTPGSGWSPTSKFAACFDGGLATYHIYYVAPSSGSILAYFRSPPTTGAWWKNQDPSWSTADGGLAAVGWSDQVRMLYESGGRLAMSAQSNATWAPVDYI